MSLLASILAAITALAQLIKDAKDAILAFALSRQSDSQSSLSEGISQDRKATTPDEARAANEKIVDNLP